MPAILIVEDEAKMRRLLELNLGEDGFTTFSAEDAETGLKLLQQNPIDLVVTDLKLPGMNGLELQRRLADEDRKIPIVFVSAHDDRASKSQALKAGATAFLNKPFGDETLLDAVDSALRPGRS